MCLSSSCPLGGYVTSPIFPPAVILRGVWLFSRVDSDWTGDDHHSFIHKHQRRSSARHPSSIDAVFPSRLRNSE